MKLPSVIFVSAFCVFLSVRAQDAPPQAPAPPPVLENTGKPLVLPFQCTAEDVQWAGLTCTEEAPCPIYLDLTAAGSAGDVILTVGNIHSSSVTLYSVVLGSTDAGRTWREVYPRVRGAGLDHLQVIDAETAWAAGQSLFPLPEDPFVLLTTDGGKTWRKQSVFSESADNRFGSITEFRFDNKTEGALAIDHGQGGDSGRYALYQSPNGGETWMIKEENNKPLHLKPSSAAVDWRVQADGPTQAFRLEHRQGDRWVSDSAFSVKLGSCKAPQ